MKERIAFPVILFIFLFLIACAGSTHTKEEKTSNQDLAFYPTVAYITEQVAKVDTQPLAVFKYTVTGNQTDSAIIPKEEFRKAAGEFLTPDISAAPLKRMYTETLLHDETTNTVTITYSANEENAEIRKTEIYVNPGNDKVKGIYIEKLKTSGDSSVIKKLYWKTDRNFQVISIVRKNNQPQATLHQKYVWDNRN